MTSDSIAVRVEDLRHRYASREALKGVSFQVRSGEIFGLLGPNGGGKTTLFRILSTLLAMTSGRVQVLGKELGPSSSPEILRSIRREIGVVFQNPSLDQKLTVYENLRHQGHLQGLRGRSLRERMRDLLKRFGLSERTHERVEALSGGLRRRVELAKGLLHHPSLLLLDEPATGLDPGARYDLWDYLRELRSEDGVTVLTTTHIMEEAERCDRIGILHLGELVALDPPGTLKSRIGGDIVSIETTSPEELARGLREKMGLEPAVVDGSVRLEQPEGHRFVPTLVESFAGQISAVTVGKPTLEDVFVHLTGHRLAEESASPSPGKAKMDTQSHG